MGEETKKNLLLIAGIFGVLFGVVLAISMSFKEQYWLMAVGDVIIMVGIVFTGIGFGFFD